MKYAVVLASLCLITTSVARAEFEPPVPVRTVAPVFPTEMRRAHMGGLVFVSCEIDVHGDVQNPKIMKCSNDAFAQPALDALRKWKFKPAQRDGANVPIKVTIPVKFTIDD